MRTSAASMSGIRKMASVASSTWPTVSNTWQSQGTSPPTSRDYTSAGLPWFDYYNDGKALPGSDTLSKLTSVAAKMIEKGKGVLPDNDPVQPKVVKIAGKGNLVRDGKF